MMEYDSPSLERKKQMRPSDYRKESAWEFKRRRAVELMENGEQIKLIERILGVTAGAIVRWHKKYLATGCIKSGQSSGRPRRLSSEQLEVLRALLSQGATAHGWHNELWTSRRVAAIIRRHFKINYTRSAAWKVVARYLGWTTQRPVLRHIERNENAIDRWKTIEFPRILREIEQKRAYLVFMDEAGFLLAPTISRTFAPRGQRPVLKTGDPHGRISAIGAISVSPKRKKLQFHYQLLPDNTNFHSDTVVRFVRGMNRSLTGCVTIICDGFRIHCSKLMLAYLKRNKRIEIEEFPPCAPELNPVDRAWAYLKRGQLANYAPRKLAELRRRLVSEFDKINRKQNVLAWCVREASLGNSLTAPNQLA